MPRKKKTEPKQYEFGELRQDSHYRETQKAIESKAANAHFKPGSTHQNRAIDPLDYDRWERQRQERKSKNHTLDPYR